MAAYALVNGTDVEAGAAADAVEGFPEGRVAEEAAASVVHNDQVELLGAVLVGGAARAGYHAYVGCEPLSGGGAGQDPEEYGEVLERGDDFFHSGDADVDTRGGGAQAAVAFVGDDDEGAGFGDEEVGAADAQIGVQEVLAQGYPGDAGQLGDVVGVGDAEVFGEEAGDLSAGFMEGRGDQVGGRFLGQLDDVFAEVGFEDGDALGFQDLVQPQFLGDHGFAFGDGAHIPGAGNFGDDGVGLTSVGGEVDLAAGGGYFPLQHSQVVVEVGDGVFFDAAGLLAPAFPDGGGGFGDGFAAGAVETIAGAAQGLAELGVLHCGLGRGDEIASGHFSHSWRPPGQGAGRCVVRARGGGGG